MSTPSLNTIAAALKLVDSKKENLRKAFEDLQCHSSLLSSFPFSWHDLDSHFTTIHNSLIDRFKLLESLESTQPAVLNGLPSTSPLPSESNQPIVRCVDSGSSPPVENPITDDPSPSSILTNQLIAPRPELKSLCEKMDGKGLRKYISDNVNSRASIRSELPAAVQCAPDPAKLILDALDEFYSAEAKSSQSKPMKDMDSKMMGLRRDCMLLMEQLLVITPPISNEVRGKAKKLALEWKARAKLKDNELLVLAFLLLVSAYGLASEYNLDELFDYCLSVATSRHTIIVCRSIGLVDKIPDLIRALISKGRKLAAVRYICEFQLADKFPPVPLLENCLTENEQLALDGKKTRRSMNKEITSLKSIIKVIEEYKLESQYSPEIIEKRIEKLEKEIADGKCNVSPPAAKPLQQQTSKQQIENPKNTKRRRTIYSTGPSVVSMGITGDNLTTAPFEQSHHMHSAGLFGLVGSGPNFAPYPGPYGLPGGPVGFPGNPIPPPIYFDGPSAYGGYGVPPPYHQYYPH